MRRSSGSWLPTTVTLLGVLAMVPGVLHAQQGAAPTELSFELLDRVYSNPNPELAPVERGPMTIRLRSPTNRITLHSHRLKLTPLGAGRHRAEFEAVIEGAGLLEADLHLAGGVQQLADEVRLPRQALSLEGVIRLDRQSDGYLITAVDPQESVAVAIDSRLVEELEASCIQVARLLFMSSSCRAVGLALSHAVVPLPGPGETFLLADSALTDGDRRRLDAYLAQ